MIHQVATEQPGYQTPNPTNILVSIVFIKMQVPFGKIKMHIFTMGAFFLLSHKPLP